MGAAVSVVDVDADGHRRPLRHQQQGGLAQPALSQPRRRHVRGRRRAAGRRRSEPARDRRVDGRRSGATTTTTASRTCCSIAGAGRSCSTTTPARRSRASPSTAGLPAWANINTAVWLDFDRDGRLDFFMGGYYPERVNLWKLADTKMMPESFEYANNGGRKYLYPQPRRRTLRGGQRARRPRARAAGRWRRSRPTCAAPAIPTSSSPTTTACRSCSSTRAAASAKSAARPASATRRRAA